MRFEPKDQDWETKTRASFARQAFMSHLGARLTHVMPGEADIELDLVPQLTQQHGFFHAGATSSIADSAAGYAALTLFPADTGVLTSEYKINLLNPARQPVIVARGRVVKPGRTLTICQSDVFGLDAGNEIHLATGLFTLMALAGMKD
ncbi:uncharacterized protein (TIGR00369 family) [Roseibium hamelinense]|uniref:Uncharacterized protein (TIGR00369 family) n=1 Tax=Roseibium hamelinense TaxID=150831 RepID=A0A562SH25_9HYPH|nr:PaaI family thioesterase [Roseibium hamelinense]MTI44177.1 PaaI family thioesterase [Roseibium hamelinense]TWI80040.1 uncharacterized protein (TIGR00369 family) [Roseibium hamelinense]